VHGEPRQRLSLVVTPHTTKNITVLPYTFRDQLRNTAKSLSISLLSQQIFYQFIVRDATKSWNMGVSLFPMITHHTPT